MVERTVMDEPARLGRAGRCDGGGGPRGSTRGRRGRGGRSRGDRAVSLHAQGRKFLVAIG